MRAQDQDQEPSQDRAGVRCGMIGLASGSALDNAITFGMSGALIGAVIVPLAVGVVDHFTR